MTMRIISGSAKGRKLATPTNFHIRPTADAVREALFSILGDLDGAIVVDGFAGTGALGCEAISRGAAQCYFFERSREAVEIIEENVRRIRGAGRARVEKCTFDYGIANFLASEPDLIFIDPPYGKALARKALISMRENPSFTEGALAMVELGIDEAIPEVPGWRLDDQRDFGRTRVLFYYREGVASPNASGEEEGKVED